MGLLQIWINSYTHPAKILDELVNCKIKVGLIFALLRGICLAVLFYLPFYYLKFEPITPAYLRLLDTPKYFLYAAICWPIFGLISCIYLTCITYLLFRFSGYNTGFDKILNLNGLLDISISVVLIIFDWFMVIINSHTNPIVLGVSHLLIADPWRIVLSSVYFGRLSAIPVKLSIFSVVLNRLLYMPIAVVFIRT